MITRFKYLRIVWLQVQRDNASYWNCNSDLLLAELRVLRIKNELSQAEKDFKYIYNEYLIECGDNFDVVPV